MRCLKFSNYSMPNHTQLRRSMSFDVAVIGGGHAGCEAALASCRVGAKTCLISDNYFTIGEMSCNPSFGGVGKGHLMLEVDALDGVCARICDQSGTHYRKLNESKGPALWGYRAQIDRQMYKSAMQEEIARTKNLTFLAGNVEDIKFTFESNTGTKRIKGLVLASGNIVQCSCAVIATGTFLDANIFIGKEQLKAGRINDVNSEKLAASLVSIGFKVGRLKTGTIC
ncbi:hypothetical protein GJ496_002799 [Pomphorhynchus laevis]|nr:hypothetical protein GJ496_002799 [Pomphorhynchus laevis]